MKKAALVVVLVIISAILIFFVGNNSLSKMLNASNNNDNNSMTNTVFLLAECADCSVCGKDIEKSGDIYLRNGKINLARQAYLEAIRVYQASLAENPSNNCIRNGLIRSRVKLKRLGK